MNPVRAGLVLAALLSLAGVAGLSAGAAVHPKVTLAQAVERLGRMLGAKPERVRLVFADERLTDVDLEWVAYAPHAKVLITGGPVGTTVPRYYRGPATAWIAASGGGFGGVASFGHRQRSHHYAVPGRSYTISVALVRRLWKENLRVRLVPLRVHPVVSRKRALELLRSHRLRPRRIWLVVERRRLAWLAAVQRGRFALLDASDGKLVAPTTR